MLLSLLLLLLLLSLLLLLLILLNDRSLQCLFNSLRGPTSKKHQIPHYWPFARGIHRWQVNSPHIGPVTRKKLLLDDVIMPRDMDLQLPPGHFGTRVSGALLPSRLSNLNRDDSVPQLRDFARSGGPIAQGVETLWQTVLLIKVINTISFVAFAFVEQLHPSIWNRTCHPDCSGFFYWGSSPTIS